MSLASLLYFRKQQNSLSRKKFKASYSAVYTLVCLAFSTDKQTDRHILHSVYVCLSAFKLICKENTQPYKQLNEASLGHMVKSLFHCLFEYWRAQRSFTKKSRPLLNLRNNFLHFFNVRTKFVFFFNIIIFSTDISFPQGWGRGVGEGESCDYCKILRI